MAYEITALSTLLTDTNIDYCNAAKLNDNDFVVAYLDADLVYVRAYNVDSSTGAITGLGSELLIDSGYSLNNRLDIKVIDASNFIVFWTNDSTNNDQVARLFSVDGSGNISTNGSEVVVDTTPGGNSPTLIQMDSTHFLFVWSGGGVDGFAQIGTIDTGAGTITMNGSSFEFNTTSATFISGEYLSATRVVLFYDGNAQVLAINTSTWAVTSGGSEFAFSTDNIDNKALSYLEDDGTSHIVALLYWNNTDDDTYIQTYKINKTTWAITAFGSATKIGGMSSGSFINSIKTLSDGNGVITFARDLDSGSSYFVQTHAYNSSTGALTLADRLIISGGDRACAVDMGGDRYVSVWQSSLQAFDISSGQEFTITDTLSLSETTTNLRARNFIATDTLSLSEVISSLKGLSFTVIDTLHLSEVFTGARTFVFNVIDSLGLSEVFNVRKKWGQVDKNSSTWTSSNKSSASTFTETNKSSSSWTETDKS